MAVYTHLSAETLSDLIEGYDVGALVSAKGIAEGVSNSNWLIDTTGAEGQGARFILTMYERRIEQADLPFFLDLLDFLSCCGLPVPRTIHSRAGRSWQLIDGKAVALIEFLPGVSVDRPNASQARAVGGALAKMHGAAQNFALSRVNPLDIDNTHRTLSACGPDALVRIDARLPETIGMAADLAGQWNHGLPTSIIHSDLFPDNVLMLGNDVTGLIDFYFACEGAMAYDLAVTHAAWSFDRQGRQFRPEIGKAIVEGYEAVRPLERSERSAMPDLAQGACLRFVASRAEDWLDTPIDAHVTRKDPMDFVRRRDFYAEAGSEAFA